MYELYEIQRDDMLPSNFQFMDFRTGEIFRFYSILKAACVYKNDNPFGINFYPRRNFVVHDKLSDGINSHLSLTYVGGEHLIVINFKFLNINIDLNQKYIFIYERYTDVHNNNKSSFFYEKISIQDFLFYNEKILEKVIYKVLRRKFAECDVSNRNWMLNLNAISSNVILDIKALIKRELKL